ncbi:MAG: hypothetical protein KAH11_03090 [Rhodospirillales bacterium]|nr:hypothetical protein [Rhodospirillales bacterium]
MRRISFIPPMVPAVGLLLGLLGLLVVAACVNRDAPADVDALTICASCHGPTGVSERYYVPNIAGQHYAYLVKQLRHFRTTHEAGDMRENATMNWHAVRMNGADIDRIARYYAGQTCQPGIHTWTGGELNNACTACHGSRGLSRDPAIPNLAGQQVYYMLRQIMAFRHDENAAANRNSHCSRSNERMGKAAADVCGDALLSAYYFNAQGCP